MRLPFTDKKRRKSGFTLIEVLIVLAIVGLIILIIFFAVPAMQRSSRNHRRSQDAVRVGSYLLEQKNLYGRYPSSCNNTRGSCFLRDLELSYYDNQSLTDNNVSFYHRTTPYDPGDDPMLDPDDPASAERISVRAYALCEPNGDMTGEGARRDDIAVQYVLESFGGNFRACRQF